MLLALQTDELKLKERVISGQLDPVTRRLFEGLCGGSRPVYYREGKKLWPTDLTIGVCLAEQGYYVSSQIWRVVTDLGLDILVPDMCAYGLVNETVRQTLENLIVVDPVKHPDQYYWVEDEDKLVTVTTLESKISMLMAITSDNRYPLYGLRKGHLVSVVTSGTAIHPGITDWSVNKNGYDRTVVSFFAQEVLGFKKAKIS